MRFRSEFKNKFSIENMKLTKRVVRIRYIIDVFDADLDDLKWSPEEARKMRELDKTSMPHKLLESLLMKIRKYERTHKIHFSDNRKRSKSIRKSWRKNNG